MTDRELSFPAPDENDADIAERVSAMYRATPEPDPALAEQCALAVRNQAMRAKTARGWSFPAKQWWWGAAAAAAVVVVIAKPWRPEISHVADSTMANAVASAATASGVITTLGGDQVRFDLTLPAGAQQVAIVGDFNGWDAKATPMARREADGSWSARVPLTPGRHVYAFVVDGTRWIIDPLAPQAPDDGFGPTNAVVIEGARK